MALVFSSRMQLQEIFQRCGAMGAAVGVNGIDELGGSAHRGTVPQTVLPFTLFDNDTPWFTLMSRRWKFREHINLGELRPVVI